MNRIEVANMEMSNGRKWYKIQVFQNDISTCTHYLDAERSLENILYSLRKTYKVEKEDVSLEGKPFYNI